MGKDKIRRFAELKTFSKVVEAGLYDEFKNDHNLKGKWREKYFGNSNPIVLELGCGKGEYTISLSEKYPEKNFIGVDIKGNRMWVGARYAMQKNLCNVMFLRTRIEFIGSFFEKDEVDEIWITFPDPQEKSRRENKRLTSPVFMDKYKNFLKPNGIIHLKTDNSLLYNYTLELVKKSNCKLLVHTANLYNSKHTEKAHDIKTHYEQLFLNEGKPIHYLQFTL